MKIVFYIIGDKALAEENIEKYFDKDWVIFPLPPIIEEVLPILKQEEPDAIIFSLLHDADKVIKLAQLTCMSWELEDTIKMYVDLTDDKKEFLLDMMTGVGGVYMVRNEIIKDELNKAFSRDEF